MPLLSITRLRVRSIRYLPSFFWYVFLTVRQVRHSPGFKGGSLIRDANHTYWTITCWEDQKAMINYRNADEHRKAMPKLAKWCDEASVVHWNQENNALPGIQEAYDHMLTEGRFSKVNHPSPAQAAKQIALPKPKKGVLPLKPK